MLAVVGIAYPFVMTWLILWVIDRTVGLRVSPGDEEAGLDLSEHAEAAYQPAGAADRRDKRSHGGRFWRGASNRSGVSKPHRAGCGAAGTRCANRALVPNPVSALRQLAGEHYLVTQEDLLAPNAAGSPPW